MGLFDFFKKKKASPEPPDETPLEVALRLASGNAAYHKAFYQELLRSNVIALTALEAPVGDISFSAGDTMKLLVLADGSIPVFSAERRIYDGGQAGQGDVRTLTLEARALLETTQGATLVLNPFSEFAKVLVPEEVEQLLDGRIFRSQETIIMTEPTTIRMAPPPVYPKALIEELQRLFQARPVVQRAYLTWCYIPSDGRPPHALIGLEVTGEAEALFKEAGAIAQMVLPAEEVADFIVVDPADPDGPSGYLRTETKPFYVRG